MCKFCCWYTLTSSAGIAYCAWLSNGCLWQFFLCLYLLQVSFFDDLAKMCHISSYIFFLAIVYFSTSIVSFYWKKFWFSWRGCFLRKTVYFKWFITYFSIACLGQCTKKKYGCYYAGTAAAAADEQTNKLESLFLGHRCLSFFLPLKTSFQADVVWLMWFTEKKF